MRCGSLDARRDTLVGWLRDKGAETAKGRDAEVLEALEAKISARSRGQRNGGIAQFIPAPGQRLGLRKWNPVGVVAAERPLGECRAIHEQIDPIAERAAEVAAARF